MVAIAPWSNGMAARTPVLAAALMAALAAAPAPAAGQELAAPAPAALRWPIPVVRIGGAVSYNARRELDAGHRAAQQGASGMLNVATDTYLWEPWFAQLTARVGVTSFRQADTYASGSVGDTASRSSFVTGETRLELVPASSFPFELHYQRSDSRSASQLTFDNALSASRLGFTQRLGWNGGDAMIGWDRSTQDEAGGGRARQDSAHLSVTQPFGAHLLRLSGSGSRHRRDADWANDGNLALVHDYRQPDSGLTVNSLAHLNNASRRIGAHGSDSDLLQLSSLAMWRPDDSDLAAVAGVRLLGFDAGSGGRDGAAALRNANLNGGASYDLTPAIRFDGSANLNYNKLNGAAMVSTQQTVRATYLPDPVATGNTRYGWNAAASAANSAGDLAGGRQLTLQLGHNAAHTLQFGRAGFSIDGAQSVAVRASSAGGPGAARHLSHSASVAWSLLNGNGVSASASASASDTRELSGTGEFYQLLTLQGSSNLVSGAHGALSGNLTVQAARQSGVILVGDGSDPLQRFTGAGDKQVTTVSSGALTYQNERWFGVPRLRLSSSLRLNSHALLPVLGKEGDRQTAAWETELEYRIGLATLRLAYLVARTPVLADWRSGLDGAPAGVDEGAQRTRRAAQFWLSRSFGRQ